MSGPPQGLSPHCCVLLLVIALVSIGSSGCEDHSSSSSHPEKHYLDYQYSSFSDEKEFYQRSFDFAAAQNVTIGDSCSGPTGIIRWGVVSHHLLIRNLIATYFLKLSQRSHPQTIVVCGPNHFARGHTPVAVSLLKWKTPIGMISPDLGLAQQMIREGLVQENEDAFYNEHSIGAVVPFIRYYFPEARIVPIIVKADADSAASEHLARFVARTASKEILFLASLDFSHYRTSDVAFIQDSLTYSILSKFDVSDYQEAYVDSHNIFRTILESCKLLGATDIVMIQHTNSGILESKPLEPCTSYMNMVICQSQVGRN
jgi:AmmeMemoRadiSam system protein B